MRFNRPLNLSPEALAESREVERLLTDLDRMTVKYLHRDFDKSHATQTLSLGAIPPNAVIDPVCSGVFVHEVFNAATNNRLDIGTAGTADLYGTDISLLALGFFPLDVTAQSFRPSQSVATELKFTVDVTGAGLTTGKASVVIKYTVPNTRV